MLNEKKLLTKVLGSISSVLVSVSSQSCTNCNGSTQNGIYKLAGANTANSPGSTGFYGVMFVMRFDSTYVSQLAISVNTKTPLMYIRSKTSSEWGSWRTLSIAS